MLNLSTHLTRFTFLLMKDRSVKGHLHNSNDWIFVYTFAMLVFSN